MPCEEQGGQLVDDEILDETIVERLAKQNALHNCFNSLTYLR